MKPFNVQILVVAGLLMSPWLPYAASDGLQNELPESLLACMDEFDVLRRLSCYDQQMARLTSTEKAISPAATVYATTKDTSEVAAPAPEEQFGMNAKLARQQAQPKTGGKPQRAELTATILKISKRPYGQLIVSLDNDQVWVEKIPSRSLRIDVGDTVTIRQGRLGGYRLFGRGNQSTEVTRIR